jgi:hypothetical protein
MRIAILQPSYLPWLGYLDQIARSDAFVFYDDVQYDKNGWRNRNRIRVPGGEGWAWLTIPVQLPTSLPRILEVTSDPRAPWRRKHLAAIRSAYARAPHLDFLDRFFGQLFAGDETRLAEIAIESIRNLMQAFAVSTPLYRSSQLGVGGDRNERLVNICRYFGASHYLSGSAARSYLDIALFERNGITVEWQDYLHPVYQQRYDPFISHLSSLDALLCAGAGAGAFLRQPDSLALSPSDPSGPV